MKMIEAKINSDSPKHFIGLERLEDSKEKTKTYIVGLWFFNIKITVPMKHMSIKNGSRDMQELIDKNIKCTDDGFITRLKDLEEKNKS